MNKTSILIIEDDPDIRELLAMAFSGESWKLLLAKTGEEGLEILKKDEADCVVLDIMLPGMDGLAVLKKIRKFSKVAVIMASARGEESYIVAGLELGADDYVVKPYSTKVLIARIRNCLRRREEEARGRKTYFKAGGFSVDTERHEAVNGEENLDLSATEFSLFLHFVSNPDRVFSRNQIISAVHGEGYPVTDRSVDVQIMSLRRKLKDRGKCIETIRGVGYRFTSS